MSLGPFVCEARACSLCSFSFFDFSFSYNSLKSHFSDENGTGGDGKYYSDNYALTGRISVFCHEVSGGKYVPRTVLSTSSPA